MAYSKSATIKYIKDKQQEIKIRYKKDEYTNKILPAIEKSGLPVATYIKQAVAEKIMNDIADEYDPGKVLESVKQSVVSEITDVFDDDCLKIILYGSCARGDYTSDSDIDVAILTKSNREDAKKYNTKLDEIATQIGIETLSIVNFVCLPYKEYEDKKLWYPYFMNIEKDGILLYERK